MSAIEKFKAGLGYVIPMTVHEIALIINFRVNQGYPCWWDGGVNVGSIIYSKNEKIFNYEPCYFFQTHPNKVNITEEFFEEICR